jgi:hypothetical protein
MDREGALPVIISLALLEDIETQEYAAFALAHLSSNRDLQVKLVNLGAVRPLVTMLASDAEPKHYAGLALLKLADNFENHLKIAEEGGIQALLRLGRTRTTDEQLQYKAALTLGQLATNAVKLLPNQSGATIASASAKGLGNTNATTMTGTAGTLPTVNLASLSHANMQTLASTNPLYGETTDLMNANAEVAGGAANARTSKVTERLRSQIAAQKAKAKDITMEFLDKSLAKTEAEKALLKAGGAGGDPLLSRSLDMSRTVTQIALNIGNKGDTGNIYDTPVANKGGAGDRDMRRSMSNEITPLHPTFTLPPLEDGAGSGRRRQSNSAGNSGEAGTMRGTRKING